MDRKFIAVIGDSDAGKTTVLNKLTEQFGAFFRKKSQTSLCILNSKIVFVRTSSPQERTSNTTIKNIENDLKKFESVVKTLRIKEYIVIMAFTRMGNKKNKETEKSKAQLVKWGYKYSEIEIIPLEGRFTKQMEKVKYIAFLRKLLRHKFVR